MGRLGKIIGFFSVFVLGCGAGAYLVFTDKMSSYSFLMICLAITGVITLVRLASR